MQNAKPRVVVTRKLPDAIETRMMELFQVELNLDDTPFTNNRMIEAVKTADVLVPTVTDHIDASILAHAGESLRLIANYGAGVDHIDMASARQRGISVTNTPDVLTEDTADMTMALILAVPRRLSEGERMLRSGKWTGAKRAKGFGLSIHYHNRQRVHEDIEAVLEATYWESLDQMLARMDFISVNCPHTPATFHLLSARRLKLLQPHAVLVNTSRGEVIDENALTRILAAGDIGGAGLDVFENEPAVNPKLLAMENVVLLPHMGSATFEGRIDMGEKVLVNIKTFCDGHTSPDRVLSDIF